MKIQIRWILRDELDWVNRQYASINFCPSTWGKDKGAVATTGSQKIGIGRLVPLLDEEYELGGIYVIPAHRGKGFGCSIISFLVENSKNAKKIYCLPFEKLKPLYNKFGFNELKPDENLPQEIQEKHKWCLKTYKEKVLVLVKTQVALT